MRSIACDSSLTFERFPANALTDFRLDSDLRVHLLLYELEAAAQAIRINLTQAGQQPSGSRAVMPDGNETAATNQQPDSRR